MGTYEPTCKEYMSSIGSRLREERERLGHSQSNLAELGGTQRKSQFNYEMDVRRPDADYLSAVAAVGVDVLYVLTGNSEGIPPLPITADEQQLLDHFRIAPAAVGVTDLGGA